MTPGLRFLLSFGSGVSMVCAILARSVPAGLAFVALTALAWWRPVYEA